MIMVNTFLIDEILMNRNILRLILQVPSNADLLSNANDPMVVNILFSYLNNSNLLVSYSDSYRINSIVFSLFMFFVEDKTRLIRDLRRQEEILAEQELWSDIPNVLP